MAKRSIFESLATAWSWTTRQRLEPWVLLSVLILGAAVSLFAEVTDDVLEGETHEFDRTVLLALRNADDPADPLGPLWLEEMLRDVTALGGLAVLLLVTAAALGYLWIVRDRATALLLIASVGGGLVVSYGLKAALDRPRPDLVSHLAHVYTASFPSGHAVLSAVTYLTLGAILARVETRRAVQGYLLAMATLLTLLVGLSRVYLGVHWPTDVAAGWCIGAAWAIACWLGASALRWRAGTVRD